MRNSKGIRVLVIFLLILILIAGILFALKVMKGKSNNISDVSNQNVSEGEQKQQLKSFAGDERAIAVMIDNNINAMPQAGLLEADLVYEIIVEGGETRLMAVLKGKNIDKIGPIRSARHYFIDYALENDALYIHYGQSPQAAEDIEKLGINNINGIYESSSNFWRVDDKDAPHNAVTNIKNVKSIAQRKAYRTTSSKKSVLNYVIDEVNLEDGQEAINVTIPYSEYNTVKYKYNEKNKTYTRYSRDKEQIDWDSESKIEVKNIIITKAENYTLNDGSGKGRQGLDNIKTLEGYYITNGKAIKITCEKTSREEQTVYKDLNGNEINVNDGKTFIQICPIDSKIEIAASEE